MEQGTIYQAYNHLSTMMRVTSFSDAMMETFESHCGRIERETREYVHAHQGQQLHGIGADYVRQIYLLLRICNTNLANAKARSYADPNSKFYNQDLVAIALSVIDEPDGSR